MSMIRIIIALMLFANPAFAEEDKIVEEWVLADIEFISQLKSEYKKSPLALLPLLKPGNNSRSDLGYGYEYVKGSIGKGYVTTSYIIVYKNGEPVSYKLTQFMPRIDELKPRYAELYEGMFSVTHHSVTPLYYNREEMERPLDGCSNTQTAVTPEIKEYMTPYSGIRYGYRGGYSNSLLQNRDAYLSMKHTLDENSYKYLLCSKNPATRLTAAEYFYSNNRTNEGLSPQIISKIEEIFSETPTITTLMGCEVTRADSRELVKRFSKHEGP
jgi:hypothetical protein